MRRAAGVVLSAALLALVLALSPGVARASLSFSTTAAYDFGLAAFHALFGETSDAGATIAAAYGDRASESPLRDLAIVRRPTAHPQYLASLGSVPTFAADHALRRTSIESAGLAGLGSVFAPSAARFVPVAFYAPVPSLPIDPPRRVDTPGGAASSAPLESGDSLPVAAPRITFGSATTPHASETLGAAIAPSSVVVPVSMRVGRLQFDGDVNAAQTQTAGADADSGYGAGADFTVRAGARRLNVDVTSSYEHLLRDDTTAYTPTAPGPAHWDIGGNAAPAIPNYADMSKLALGANIAVPVTHTMTLNLNYNAQRLLGEYGLPGIGNLDATDNSLGGNVTFAIPRWSSQLSVSASQYHYQDFIAPSNTFSDLRGNVNFTVKF